jgi:predicted HAD superfamily Cof-like phosphohydrolase
MTIQSRIARNLSLKSFEQCVAEFHEKLDVSPATRLSETSDDQAIKANLLATAYKLMQLSEELEGLIKQDIRYLRVHLMCEELAEVIEGLATKSEHYVFDGLCDLLYVLIGTAVTFDMPVSAGFYRVHASNMTKTRKSDDPGRVRDKGEGYIAPRLNDLLND